MRFQKFRVTNFNSSSFLKKIRHFFNSEREEKMNINTGDKRKNIPLAIERLTALWALNEAGLGGIMHAFKTPFTGVFVGGIAVCLIVLIGYFSNKNPKTIIKATFIVLIIKAMVSPHSPLAAYLAVGFQGFFGAFLFSISKNIRLNALVLGVFALVESAFQKIITLTLIFGMSFWEAIDIFVDYVLKKMGFLASNSELWNSSLWLVGLYLTIYFFSGIFIGLLAGHLPFKMEKTLNDKNMLEELKYLHENNQLEMDSQKVRNKNRFAQKTFVILFFLALIMIVFPFLAPASKGGWSKAIYVLIRTLIIVLVWFLWLAPWLTKKLLTYLQKKKGKYSGEVSRTVNFLPHLRQIVFSVWHHSRNKKGFFQRWYYFLSISIAYSLIYEKPETVIDNKP